MVDGTASDINRPLILLVGDSLTQHGSQMSIRGWVSQLVEWYEGKADVINRGFSGYTSRVILPIVKNLLQSARAQWGGTTTVDNPTFSAQENLVVLCIGANDAALPESAQHVPLEEYEQNVRACVHEFKSWNGFQTILIPPPPLIQAKWDNRCINFGQKSGFRALDTTREYANVIAKIAAEEKVHFVDLWQHESLWINESEQLLSDGLHLSPKGNDLFFKLLTDCIRENVHEMSAERLSLVPPYWKHMLGLE